MIWGVKPTIFGNTHILLSLQKTQTIYPRGKLTYPTKREKENHHRLQNCLFLGDMLVPRRVYLVDLPKSLALKSPVSNPRGARFCPAALHPPGRSTTGTPKNGGLVGCCVFSNWVMHLGSFRRSFSGVYWLRWGLATYSWLKFSFCVGKYKTHPKRCNQRCHTTLPGTRGFCVILKKWRKIWRISKSLLCSRQKQILALQQPTDFCKDAGGRFCFGKHEAFSQKIPVQPIGRTCPPQWPHKDADWPQEMGKNKPIWYSQGLRNKHHEEKFEKKEHPWLVVEPTHLKNMGQNGNLPQVSGWKWKKIIETTTQIISFAPFWGSKKPVPFDGTPHLAKNPFSEATGRSHSARVTTK